MTCLMASVASNVWHSKLQSAFTSEHFQLIVLLTRSCECNAVTQEIHDTWVMVMYYKQQHVGHAFMFFTAPPSENWKRPQGRPRITGLNTVQWDLHLTLLRTASVEADVYVWHCALLVVHAGKEEDDVSMAFEFRFRLRASLIAWVSFLCNFACFLLAVVSLVCQYQWLNRFIFKVACYVLNGMLNCTRWQTDGWRCEWSCVMCRLGWRRWWRQRQVATSRLAECCWTRVPTLLRLPSPYHVTLLWPSLLTRDIIALWNCCSPGLFSNVSTPTSVKCTWGGDAGASVGWHHPTCWPVMSAPVSQPLLSALSELFTGCRYYDSELTAPEHCCKLNRMHDARNQIACNI